MSDSMCDDFEGGWVTVPEEMATSLGITEDVILQTKQWKKLIVLMRKIGNFVISNYLQDDPRMGKIHQWKERYCTGYNAHDRTDMTTPIIGFVYVMDSMKLWRGNDEQGKKRREWRQKVQDQINAHPAWQRAYTAIAKMLHNFTYMKRDNFYARNIRSVRENMREDGFPWNEAIYPFLGPMEDEAPAHQRQAASAPVQSSGVQIIDQIESSNRPDVNVSEARETGKPPDQPPAPVAVAPPVSSVGIPGAATVVHAERKNDGDDDDGPNADDFDDDDEPPKATSFPSVPPHSPPSNPDDDSAPEARELETPLPSPPLSPVSPIPQSPPDPLIGQVAQPPPSPPPSPPPAAEPVAVSQTAPMSAIPGVSGLDTADDDDAQIITAVISSPPPPPPPTAMPTGQVQELMDKIHLLQEENVKLQQKEQMSSAEKQQVENLENQIATMKKKYEEALAAEKARVTTAEQANATLSTNHEKLQKMYKELEQRLSDLQLKQKEREAAYDTKMVDLVKEMSNLSDALRQKDSDIEQEQEKLKKLKGEMDTLRSENVVLAQDIQKMATDDVQARQQSIENAKRIDARIKATSERIEECEAEIRKLSDERNGLLKQRNDLMKRVTELEGEIETLKLKHKQEIDNLISTNQDHLKAQRNELEQKITSLQNEIKLKATVESALNAQISKLKADIQVLTDGVAVSEVVKRNTSRANHVLILEAKIAAMEKQVRTNQEEIAMLRSQLDSANTILKQKEAEVLTLRQTIDQMKSDYEIIDTQLKDLQAQGVDVITLRAELEALRETSARNIALKQQQYDDLLQRYNLAQEQLVTMEQTYKANLEKLRDQYTAQNTQHLETIASLRREISTLKGQIALLEGNVKGVDERERVTRETMKANNEEISRLQQQIASLQAQNSSLLQQHDALLERSNQLTNILSLLRVASPEEAKAQVESVQRLLEDNNDQIQLLTEELKKETLSVERLEGTISLLNLEKTNLSKSLEELQEEKIQAMDLREQNNELIKALRTRIQQIEGQLANLQVDYEKLKQVGTTVQEKEVIITQQQQEYQKLKADAESKIRQLEDHNIQLAGTLQQLELEKANLLKQISQLTQQVESLDKEKTDALKRIQDMEKSYAIKVEELKQNHTAELENLSKRLREQYFGEVEGLRRQLNENLDKMEEQQENIKRLTQQLEGEQNLSADLRQRLSRFTSMEELKAMLAAERQAIHTSRNIRRRTDAYNPYGEIESVIGPQFPAQAHVLGSELDDQMGEAPAPQAAPQGVQEVPGAVPDQEKAPQAANADSIESIVQHRARIDEKSTAVVMTDPITGQPIFYIDIILSPENGPEEVILVKVTLKPNGEIWNMNFYNKNGDEIEGPNSFVDMSLGNRVLMWWAQNKDNPNKVSHAPKPDKAKIENDISIANDAGVSQSSIFKMDAPAFNQREHKLIDPARIYPILSQLRNLNIMRNAKKLIRKILAAIKVNYWSKLDDISKQSFLLDSNFIDPERRDYILSNQIPLNDVWMALFSRVDEGFATRDLRDKVLSIINLIPQLIDINGSYVIDPKYIYHLIARVYHQGLGPQHPYYGFGFSPAQAAAVAAVADTYYHGGNSAVAAAAVADYEASHRGGSKPALLGSVPLNVIHVNPAYHDYYGYGNTPLISRTQRNYYY